MRITSRTGWRSLALLAVSATLTACGTTVPLTSQVQSGTSVAGAQEPGTIASGDGVDPTGSATSGGATGEIPGAAGNAVTSTSAETQSGISGTGPAAGTSSGVAHGVTSGSSGPGSKTVSPAGATSTARPGKEKATAATSAAPKSGTQAGSTVVNGPGITPTTISIGFPYSPDSTAGLAALGVNLDQGSVLDEMNAFAAEINKSGGMAGRTVKIVPFSYNNNDAVDAQEQSACAALTQDTPTAAILAGSNGIFLNCTAKAGILSFGTDVGDVTAAEYAANPQRFDVGSYPMEPAATALANELSRDGYLTTKWDTTNAGPGGLSAVKVGILYNSSPEEGAFVTSLLAGLKAKGVVPDSSDVIQYTQSNDASSAAAQEAGIQASVLQMRSDNVTNFIAVDPAALGFFASSANTQKYYPRIAMTSINEPQVDETSGLIPAKTLTGAVGYGWLPSVDLTDYSAFSNPGQPLCRKALTDSGIPDTVNSFQEAEAFGFCDDLYVLKRGIDSVPKGQPINVQSVIAGIDALGSSFPFANLPSGTYASNRNYPVYQGYPLAWDAGCTCAKYTGPAYKL